MTELAADVEDEAIVAIAAIEGQLARERTKVQHAITEWTSDNAHNGDPKRMC